MITITADPVATDAFELPQSVGLAAVPSAKPQDAMGPEPAEAEPALNPAPGWGEVVHEQLAAVGLSLRREGMVAGGLALLFTAFILYTQVTDGPAEIPITPFQGVATALMALLIPMAVWKGEEPARRGYHHAMPVDRAQHAFARGGAGLAWTLAAVAAFFGWMLMLTLLTGGRSDAAEPWQWLAPFAGATVMYLFGSALTLLTAHPWRWLGGGAVGFLFLNVLGAGDRTGPLSRLLREVMFGDFGVGRLITGVSPPALSPGFGAWLTSVWIWLVAALAAFLFAAHRQPER